MFDKSHRPILIIMAAVLVWGSLHALGAYLFEHDYRKPIVVYGFLLMFLGLWAAMLAIRNRRLAREHWHDAESSPEDAHAGQKHTNSTELPS